MRIDFAKYRNVLLMVQVLHERGYQRLRIAPGMSASGAYWRCSVTPVTNMLRENGARLQDWDGLVAHYTTGQEQQYFGWDDAADATPARMAELFIERFPDVAAAGLGPDWAYAGWYQELMRLTDPDAFPIAYSDYFDDAAGGLPCVGSDRVTGLVIPMPPPGLAMRSAESVGPIMSPCPTPLPDRMRQAMRALAVDWRDSALRPAPSDATIQAWRSLLSDWVARPDLPLLIRKHDRNRGHLVQHATGRYLVPVDNTPAHWAMRQALVGVCPSVAEIVEAFDGDGVPVAMAMSATEASQARYTKKSKVDRELNSMGWKVCHARSIGIRTPGSIAEMPIAALIEHFWAFLDPGNMFLVPKVWAGFGELPEVVAVFAGFDSGHAPTTET